MRIAMISEHASPLVAPGGVDAGGQNLHVAELSTALARRGHEVRVYTRRHDADRPQIVDSDGFQVVNGSRGFLYNADPVGTIRFLDIGTRTVADQRE